MGRCRPIAHVTFRVTFALSGRIGLCGTRRGSSAPGGSPGVVKVLLDENFPLGLDDDFLSGAEVAATIVVSRVRQPRPLDDRIWVWSAAVNELVKAQQVARRFELTDDGVLVRPSISSPQSSKPSAVVARMMPQ